MALNFVAAYDINKNRKLLDVAEEVLNHLSEALPDVVHYQMNLCQIEVRKRGILSEESLTKLDSLKIVMDSLPEPENEEKANIKRVFYYCSAVVKGEIAEADLLYNTLSDADKTGVDDWPIRALHLQLKEDKS